MTIIFINYFNLRKSIEIVNYLIKNKTLINVNYKVKRILYGITITQNFQQLHIYLWDLA